MAQSVVLDGDASPSTAKMTLVSLDAGNAPVVVKTDSQMLGDIAASNSKPATFQIWVKDDARPGKYSLPLRIKYTYLAEADQQGTESVTYRYTDRDMTIDLPFVIRSAINLDVTQVKAQDINAGGSGYLLATLKNNGVESGSKTIAKIAHSEGSPVIPVDSSVYIGSFAPGDEVNTKFKVSVSKDAQGQNYPLDLYATYENTDGVTLDTPVKTLGISVAPKIKFSAVGKPIEISQGESKRIEVTYRNDADTTAYLAEARIKPVGSLKSSDNLAYLGDIKSGETATAVFEISASGDTETKEYAVDSEIRFRDALGTSQTSDTIKVPVEVTMAGAVGLITADPLAILVLLAIIVGGGYYFGVRRKETATKSVRDGLP
ncbi:MAG TPA: S-layer protein [Methanospirillum sp.]|uniref:COG1361 S-layer family protein n=1 Tax=Methanospirillum sp. TaxID=45200 RepID=UPI002B64FCF1|nr:S-layer protein [Methanospirillum sp.]HWQ63921.1 S-layer protein [Methanospirillum sp.]